MGDLSSLLAILRLQWRIQRGLPETDPLSAGEATPSRRVAVRSRYARNEKFATLRLLTTIEKPLRHGFVAAEGSVMFLYRGYRITVF